MLSTRQKAPFHERKSLADGSCGARRRAELVAGSGIVWRGECDCALAMDAVEKPIGLPRHAGGQPTSTIFLTRFPAQPRGTPGRTVTAVLAGHGSMLIYAPLYSPARGDTTDRPSRR
jgi:hypothetical protein